MQLQTSLFRVPRTIVFKYSRMDELKEQGNFSQYKEQLYADVGNIIIYNYLSKQQHAALKNLEENKINISEYIGSGQKNYCVGVEKFEIEDNVCVILRDRQKKNPFPEFYSVDEEMQPQYNRLIKEYLMNAKQQIKDIKDFSEQITIFSYMSQIEDIQKWMFKKGIKGKTSDDQLRKLFELDDESFEILFKDEIKQ